jgi:hypothetical protein
MSALSPDQIKSLKPKDRVRITVEGEVVGANDECFTARLDGDDSIAAFLLPELTAPTASVTLLPPRLDDDTQLATKVVADLVQSKGQMWVQYGSAGGPPLVETALAAIRAANARSKA